MLHNPLLDFGNFGVLKKLGDMIVKDEEYLEFRINEKRKYGLNHAEYTPPGFFFSVADPNLARFLMNLPPSIVKKAGLTPEVFLSDKNGLGHNLIMEEGEVWQRHRKIISKMLHLDILDTYIEPMDISAQTFVEQLTQSSSPKVSHA